MEWEGQVEGAEMGPPRCRFQDAFFCLPRNSWLGFILQLFHALLMWREEAVKQRAAGNSKVIGNGQEPETFRPIGGKERRSLFVLFQALGRDSGLCTWTRLASSPGHRGGWVQWCVGIWTIVELTVTKSLFFLISVCNSKLKEAYQLSIRYSQRWTDCYNDCKAQRLHTGHGTYGLNSPHRNPGGREWELGKGRSCWDDASPPGRNSDVPPAAPSREPLSASTGLCVCAPASTRSPILISQSNLRVSIKSHFSFHSSLKPFVLLQAWLFLIILLISIYLIHLKDVSNNLLHTSSVRVSVEKLLWHTRGASALTFEPEQDFFPRHQVRGKSLCGCRSQAVLPQKYEKSNASLERKIFW